MKSFIVLLAIIGAALAAQQSFDQFKVYVVTPTSAEQADLLHNLESNEGVDFWDSLSRVGGAVRVMVAPESQQWFVESLEKYQIEHQLIINNVEDTLVKERAHLAAYRMRTIGQAKATADFTHFWDFDEIQAYLDEISENFSDVVEVETLGQSYEGRNVRAAKISASGSVDGSRPIILADGTIHAREWIATMISMHLIHELVEHSDENAAMLDGIDWIIVPVANPDGFAYTWSDNRFWRKTRSINAGSTCVGVDPNRNFEYQWSASGGASDSACSETYRGTAPNTEKEVALLSELMTRYDNIKLYIAIHSYGQYLLYPWGYARLSIANSDVHDIVGTRVQNAISAVAGTAYRLGGSGEVLYLSSGVSVDHAAGGANITLSFTIELPGGGSQGFDIPATRIVDVADETFEGFKVFADFVREEFVATN